MNFEFRIMFRRGHFCPRCLYPFEQQLSNPLAKGSLTKLLYEAVVGGERRIGTFFAVINVQHDGVLHVNLYT